MGVPMKGKWDQAVPSRGARRGPGTSSKGRALAHSPRPSPATASSLAAANSLAKYCMAGASVALVRRLSEPV